jgi:hypothetical protein
MTKFYFLAPFLLAASLVHAVMDEDFDYFKKDKKVVVELTEEEGQKYDAKVGNDPTFSNVVTRGVRHSIDKFGFLGALNDPDMQEELRRIKKN